VRALAAGADHAAVLRLIALGVGRGGHSPRPAFIAADRDPDSRRFRALHAVRAADPLVKLMASYLDGPDAEIPSGIAPHQLRSVPAGELPVDLADHLTQLGCAGLRVGTIAVDGEAAGMLISVEPCEAWQDGAWPPSTTDHWMQLLDLSVVAFERDRAQSRLLHAATYDSLTGVPNRAHFFERLSRLAKRSALAVMYLDLDHFKAVNDQLGHARGDDVLSEVARRLRLTVRPGDLIGRLGGDEFAIAISDAGNGVVAELAQRLLDAVAAPMPKRFRVDRVTASIGYALVERGSNIDELVHRADAAMLLVKQSGRRNVVGEG
jgi:diguanylate cyclase (GGDEF)-like protein